MQNEDPNAFGGPTMTIKEKIKLFAELSGDERRKVEQYVEEHGDEQPQLRALLNEAKRLEDLLDSARILREEPPGKEALALYVAMRGVDAARMPKEIAAAFGRIREQIERDPELQNRIRALEDRGAELDRASDAERQFARLVGVPAAGATDGAARDREPVSSDADRPTVRKKPASPEPGSASPRVKASSSPRASRRMLLRAAAAVFAVAALYGILFAAGRLAQPEYERIAQFDSAELVVEGYEEVRGQGDPGVTPTTSAYIEALGHLRDAETSFLGLFPRFREAPLDSAMILLRAVIADEPDDTFLAHEAHYFLGKTELARGNVAAARRSLEHVAQSPGVRSEDAQSVLDQTAHL